MHLIQYNFHNMNKGIEELETLMAQNLKAIVSLQNEVERKNLEKHDQLKDISLGIIDAIDSFERADEAIKKKVLDKNDDLIKTINRYSIISKKLLNLLQKFGITRIAFPDNRLIVGLCEVIDTVADKDRKNDEIVSIIRNGYIRGNELIRAAQIVVVKN